MYNFNISKRFTPRFQIYSFIEYENSCCLSFVNHQLLISHFSAGQCAGRPE